MWMLFHEGYQVGIFWDNIPSSAQRGKCGVHESIEHKLTECEEPGQKEIWEGFSRRRGGAAPGSVLSFLVIFLSLSLPLPIAFIDRYGDSTSAKAGVALMSSDLPPVSSSGKLKPENAHGLRQDNPLRVLAVATASGKDIHGNNSASTTRVKDETVGPRTTEVPLFKHLSRTLGADSLR
ncbi:hypothetical protein B0H19DRAFT_1262059 [Mycena capillaripes]|nr:hypothetical protein B0H19DRAFT_1262059 [Mycena capillaripes]